MNFFAASQAFAGIPHTSYSFTIGTGDNVDMYLEAKTQGWNPSIPSMLYMSLTGKFGHIYGNSQIAASVFVTGMPTGTIPSVYVAPTAWVFGNGGVGGYGYEAGAQGGIAFYANCPTILINDGKVFGGGGGGGGGGSEVMPFNGGGGAGIPPGSLEATETEGAAGQLDAGDGGNIGCAGQDGYYGEPIFEATQGGGAGYWIFGSGDGYVRYRGNGSGLGQIY